MNKTWLAPIRDFLRDVWENHREQDDQKVSTEDLLKILDHALTVLVPINNQDQGPNPRLSQFNSGGEPEQSRVSLYNALVRLKGQRKYQQIREVVRKHLPDLELSVRPSESVTG